MTGRCPSCGAETRLGPDGRCAWPGGCEHRQAVRQGRLKRAEAELASRVDDAFAGLCPFCGDESHPYPEVLRGPLEWLVNPDYLYHATFGFGPPGG